MLLMIKAILYERTVAVCASMDFVKGLGRPESCWSVPAWPPPLVGCDWRWLWTRFQSHWWAVYESALIERIVEIYENARQNVQIAW